jgi:hypothetical protein
MTPIKPITLLFFALLLVSSLAFSAQQATAGAVIQGTVVSAENGEPIAGVAIFGPSAVPIRAQNNIIVNADEVERGRIQTKTRPDGRFRLEIPTTGRVTLQFEKTPFLPRSMVYSVNANQNLEAGQIRLSRSGTIRGRVVNVQGEPVVDSTITAYRFLRLGGKQEVVDTARTQTNDRGEFRLTDLRANEYLINIHSRSTVRSNGWSMTDDDGRFSFFYPGVKEMSKAVLVVVDSNEADLKDVIASPGNRLGVARLRLTRQPNAPESVGIYIRNLTVSEGYTFGEGSWYSGGGTGAPTMLSLSQDVTRTYWLHSPGIYEIRWVDPTGREAMYATKRFEFTGADIDVEFPIGPRPEVRVNLTILAEGADDLQDGLSKIRPAFCLFGADVCVAVPAGGNAGPLGPSFPRNRWEVTVGPIPSGLYRPIFFGLPPDVYEASIKQGDRDVLRDGAVVEERTTPIEVRFRKGKGSLHGQVVDLQNKPVHYAQVVLAEDPPVSTQQSLYYRNGTRTDQNGNFEFTNLRPGNYRVYSGSDPNRNFSNIRIAEQAREVVKIVLENAESR